MTGLDRVGAAIASWLAAIGVIEERHLRETVDLAWPRVVTGFAIMSKRTVDLAIVGFAFGAPAVAGLTVASAYWMLGKFVAIGLAGGTIALVSQNFGGGENDRAREVVEASLWVTAALSIPVVVTFGLAARPLVGLLGAGDVAARYGAIYLAVIAPGLLFEYLNVIASRTYAGVGDTKTAMAIRAAGAVLNMVLSAAFVFVAGLGVAGAALGTVLSTGLVTLTFSWGMSGRTYFGRGASPIPLAPRLPRFDRGIVVQLLRVSAPLVGRRLGEGVVVFPLLAIAGTFGSVAVAAVGVGRQVRGLINSFSWGFSIAASTLVGQSLGRGDEHEAEAYGASIARFSFVIYCLVALVVLVTATHIAAVFVDAPAHVALSATFVQVAAISVIPLGVNASIMGALRGAGDTQVPFVATLLGLYVFAVPIAWAGTVTTLGILALQVALVAETLVPMVVDVWRFRTERWKAVSRSIRPTPGD